MEGTRSAVACVGDGGSGKRGRRGCVRRETSITRGQRKHRHKISTTKAYLVEKISQIVRLPPLAQQSDPACAEHSKLQVDRPRTDKLERGFNAVPQPRRAAQIGANIHIHHEPSLSRPGHVLEPRCPKIRSSRPASDRERNNETEGGQSIRSEQLAHLYPQPATTNSDKNGSGGKNSETQESGWKLQQGRAHGNPWRRRIWDSTRQQQRTKLTSSRKSTHVHLMSGTGIHPKSVENASATSSPISSHTALSTA